MSASALRPLRVLGLWFMDRDELRDAMVRLLDYPNECGGVCAELQCGAWLPVDHAMVSSVEVAAVRWLEVHQAAMSGHDEAAPGTISGELVAKLVREAGFSALSFMRGHGYATREQAAVLGLPLAGNLAVCLDGRIYMLPSPHWCAEKAQRIKADIEAESAASYAEHAAGESPEGWQICAERMELFDWLEAETARRAAT